MPQYRRFLSYLYEYERDVKGSNCGFAKMEVRGETTRIQITVSGRMAAEPLQVEGFYREGDRCVGVPLGRMTANGGRGQFQYITTGSKLWGSKVPFDRLAGLVLFVPQAPGRACATVWDDDPFGLSMFEETEGKNASGKEPAQPAEETGVQPEAFGQEVLRMRPAEETGREAESREAERAEATGKEFEPARGGSGRSGEESQPVQEAAGQRGEESQPVQEAADQSGEELRTEEYRGYTDEASVQRTDSEPARREQPIENASDPGWDEEDVELFWAGLCRRFPKIESLPDDEVTCLRAVPADIGRLPRPNWIFGNNGFLMYSYVRYRYIVFARVNRASFELWAPGIYGRNEELLAEMFGFERFRSMKAAEASPGDFGYWCVPLYIPVKKEGFEVRAASVGR